MGFTFRRGDLVPIQPKEFNREVTVWVRPGTVQEVASLFVMADDPAELLFGGDSGKRKTGADAVAARIDTITGLDYELQAGEAAPVGLAVREEPDGKGGTVRKVDVRDVVTALALLPIWVYGVLVQAVRDGSTVPPSTLGKSLRQSSGAATTKPETAETAEREV